MTSALPVLALPTELLSYTFTSRVFQSVGNNPVVNEYLKELTIHVHILSRCEVGSDRALWGLVSIQYFQVFFCSIYRLLFCQIRGKLLCSYVNTDEKYKFIS